MPVTPQITLNFTLLDMSGVQTGSSAQPAYLRIALCGFGAALPRVPGTAMIAKVATWPQDIPYTGASGTVQLFGNDVIQPSGTYYCISILDINKNVIQSNIYTFTGTQTVDLSSAIATIPSPGFINSNGIVQIPFASALQIPGTGSQLSMYQIQLQGDVTSNSFTSLTPGLVVFEISQDSAGTHKWVWPSNVQGGGVVNPLPNSTSTQLFFFDGMSLRPLGSMVYS